MPAALTVPKLLAKLFWGLDDKPIESTQQNLEAALQLDYLKGSTCHWKKTDARLTQEDNGVSVLQARDRIRAKMREAVAEGRASRRSKHQKALSDAAAVAGEHKAIAAASQNKNARILRAVAKVLEEKDSIAEAAVVAQHNNLQLAKELAAGEPDEELLEGAEDTEPDQGVAAGSAEPPPKRRKAAPPTEKADAEHMKAKPTEGTDAAAAGAPAKKKSKATTLKRPAGSSSATRECSRLKRRSSNSDARGAAGASARLAVAPQVRFPKHFTTQLKDLFAESDARQEESMAWLVGVEIDGWTVLTDLVVTPHEQRNASFVVTQEGEEKLRQFMERAGDDAVLFGWVHSHHTGLQRHASAADLQSQCVHQGSAAHPFVMCIVWGRGVEDSAGMSVEWIKPERLPTLRARGGVIDESLQSEEIVADYLEPVKFECKGRNARTFFNF